MTAKLQNAAKRCFSNNKIEWKFDFEEEKASEKRVYAILRKHEHKSETFDEKTTAV